MSMNPRLLRPTANDSPASIPGLALWLDASAADALYTTDAGPVTAVSSPLDISGCVGWWDASDASTITESGGLVSQWDDKSGEGLSISQATPSSRPATGTRTLNGKNVLDFDGVDDLLSLGTYSFSSIIDSRAMTLVAVFASDDPNAVRRMFSLQRTGKNSNDTGVFVGRHTANSGSIDFATGAGASTTNDQADKNLINVYTDTAPGPGVYGFSISAAANSKSMFKDGSAPTNTVRYGTLAASGFLSEGSGDHTIDIGASRNSANTIGAYWDGYIAEIIVYDSALSTSDRARVEAYLASKWGISGVHAPAVTASDPVGYWRDRSGNGRHATQSTAASRPVVGAQNGRRALTFDGSNDWLATSTLSINQPLTVFWAGQVSGAGSTYAPYIVDGSASGDRVAIGWNSDGLSKNGRIFFFAGGGVIEPASGQQAYGSWSVVANVFDGASSLTRANGAQVATGNPGANNVGALTLGARFNQQAGAFLNGPWGEFLIYSRALSTAERRKVERYLARRWGITLAPQVSNAEAQDWISRVYAAGSTVSQPVANAVSAFVDGCQADGIWDAMKSVVLLAGADTLAGALAPLKGTAPTSYNFASGDYNKTSGLKGNGSSTYLDSNRNNNADPQDDSHNAVYVSVAQSVATIASYMGAGFNSAGDSLLGSDALSGWLVTRNRTAAGELFAGTASATGFFGASRSESASYNVRFSGTTNTVTTVSDGVSAADVLLYRRSNGAYTDARLAFYSIGENLDLALLDARVSALMTAIGVS